MSKTLGRFGAACSLLCFLGSLPAFPATAQESGDGQSEAVPENSARESPRAARVRALNNRLLLLHSQMQAASPSEVDSFRGQAATVIVQRAAALSALIEYDPRSALSFAFSPELLDQVAKKFPGSASLLEAHGTWRGPTEVWVADYPPPAHSRTTVRVKAGTQWLQVHFAGAPPANLLSGGELEATGVLVGRALAVSRATVQASTTTSIGRDN